MDDWFDLEARSSRSNVEGQIRLKIGLATREDRGYSEEANYNELTEHEDLMGVFIEHELKNFKVSCTPTHQDNNDVSLTAYRYQSHLPNNRSNYNP